MLLKEQFLSLYEAGDRKTAYTNLRQWIVAVIKSGIPSFVELGYKFFRKRHYVLNYFHLQDNRSDIRGHQQQDKAVKAHGLRL